MEYDANLFASYFIVFRLAERPMMSKISYSATGFCYAESHFANHCAARMPPTFSVHHTNLRPMPFLLQVERIKWLPDASPLPIIQ